MASSAIFCSTCGAANDPQASLCYACGHTLQASAAAFTRPDLRERAPQERAYNSQQMEEQSFYPSNQIYQPLPQYGFSPPPGPPSQPVDGLAIAGFICAVLGVFACWFFVGVPFCIVGLVISAMGMRSGQGKGMAIAGFALSIIGLVIAVLVFFVIFIFGY